MIRNLFIYVRFVKMYISSNNCLLSHRCFSQLRENIVCLQNKTVQPVQIYSKFDIVPINNYTLWNITKSRVSKCSKYPTLACSKQENSLTAKQKDWPQEKHHLRIRRLKSENETRKQGRQNVKLIIIKEVIMLGKLQFLILN